MKTSRFEMIDDKGDQCTQKPNADVAQRELQQKEQIPGGPVNCTHSELCTYLRGLEEGYLAICSSDTTPYALSKSNPIASKSYQHGKKTVAFHGFPSLRMCKPLTDDLGEGVLTSYLAGFPVRTFQSQEKEQESKASDPVCGNTWRESLARYCRNTSTWKTHQCLWEEDLPSSSLTLPKWGMMRSGVLWERTTPEHLTSEIGSGSSPNWQTPTANLAEHSGQVAWKEGQQLRLTQQVNNPHLWPTPRAGNPGSRPNGKGGKILAEEVKKSVMWPTPTAQGAKNNGAPSQMERNTKPLNAEVGGSLNPNWVEWLMGWPIGWTDCDVSATDKFQQWQGSHGKF
jgi:hypothetical protein